MAVIQLQYLAAGRALVELLCLIRTEGVLLGAKGLHSPVHIAQPASLCMSRLMHDAPPLIRLQLICTPWDTVQQ